MATYQSTVEIDGYEVAVKIEYTYHKSSKGSRDSYGVPMEPDEPALVEIGNMYIESNDAFIGIELPAGLVEDFEEEILNEHE